MVLGGVLFGCVFDGVMLILRIEWLGSERLIDDFFVGRFDALKVFHRFDLSNTKTDNRMSISNYGEDYTAALGENGKLFFGRLPNGVKLTLIVVEV
jgi:hypothetical protein